ncbi:hypothetical protein T492DRAFT_944175 [Pavlovales sp. CCMP2436]|nr:hypothetical protein T492DRAFT_944175 [Pavlovales sp. CCMP2436]
MSCFLMRAAASIGLTFVSAYILRPPCAAISLTSEGASALTSPKAPMTIPRIGLTVLSLASIGPMLAFGPFRWGPGSARPNTLSWARAFMRYSASRGFARRATPGGRATLLSV